MFKYCIQDSYSLLYVCTASVIVSVLVPHCNTSIIEVCLDFITFFLFKFSGTDILDFLRPRAAIYGWQDVYSFFVLSPLFFLRPWILYFQIFIYLKYTDIVLFVSPGMILFLFSASLNNHHYTNTEDKRKSYRMRGLVAESPGYTAFQKTKKTKEHPAAGKKSDFVLGDFTLNSFSGL